MQDLSFEPKHWFMNYRILTVLSCFLALSVSSCSTPEASNAQTTLIPLNSSIILRINNAYELGEFVDSSDIPAAHALPVRYLNGLNQGKWTGALCSSGADKLDWIWTTAVGDSSNLMAIGTSIASYDSGYFAVRSAHAVAFSKSETLLQAALNQSSSAFNILDNAAFAKLWNNANASDAANIFVQHEELEQIGKWYAEENWLWMEHLASWTEIDLDFKKGRVLMNTVSINPDSSNTFFSTFERTPTDKNVSEIIAASSSHAVKMDVGNTVEWLRSFNAYRGRKQRLKQALNVLRPLEIEPLAMASWFQGSFVNIGYGSEKVVAARLNEGHGLEEVLKRISNDNTLFQGHPVGSLKETNRFLFSAVFGWWYKNLGTPSWMIYDDWLLVSSSIKTLDVYSNELSSNSTWDKVDALGALADGIDKKGHFSIAFKGSSESAEKYLHLVESENFHEFVIQGHLEVKGDLSFGDAKSAEVEKEKVETSTYIWSTELKSAIANGPWLVKNHRTGQTDVFVQDSNHRVYWVSNDGSVKWEKQLEEPIVGSVQQVDLFKNKKFQLLFATSTHLQCIDLLGRNVESYPISLKDSTSLGVQVLDYDKNRNYRFLVPCGADLLNFSSEGKRIEGWKIDASQGEQLVMLPQLFQKGGKDYIVTSTPQGMLVLNRRGEIRLKTGTGSEGETTWSIKNDAIPYAERIGSDGNVQKQSWNGDFTSYEDGLGALQGLTFMPYGKVVWTEDVIEVRNENGEKTYEADAIQDVLPYPGGTGIVVKEGSVNVLNLKSGDSIGSFMGSGAIAGRLSPTGKPVLLLGQGAALICYEL